MKESHSEHKRWAEEAISKIRIKGNERVLDIGCGDGKITAYIASLVPEGSVVGIDNSAEMISFAQSKFPQLSWPNLSFQYGDATDLQYEGEFDLVVSFASLHWILDHKPVLEGDQTKPEIKRQASCSVRRQRKCGRSLGCS